MNTDEAKRRLSASYTRQLAPAPRGRTMLWILCAWFAGAMLFVSLGGLDDIGVRRIPIITWSIVGALFLGYAFIPRFRAWCLEVDVRALMSVHLLRFVGVYFLVLHSQDRLPSTFAVASGWGDISVAWSALAVIVFVPRDKPIGRVLYGGWNAIALVDILAVLALGMREADADPESMAAIVELPLSLMPTFIVPLILFSHMLIFLRLSSLAHRRADFF